MVPWVVVVGGGALVGYAVARRPKVAIVLVLGLGIGLLVVQRNLRLLVPLTTVALVLGSSTLQGGSLWFVLKFMMIGAVAATIVPAMTSRRQHLPVPVSFAICSGVLVGLMVASTAWSVAPKVTANKAISMMLLLLAVALAIPLGLRDRRDLLRVIRWIGYVAAGTVIAALVLGAAGLAVLFETNGRFQGILANPNTLGYFVAPILPALVILAARSHRGTERALLSASIAVLVIALALTGSRAGALASTTGILVAFFASATAGQRRHARRILLVVTLGLGSILTVFFSLHIQPRHVGGSFFQLGTGSGRTTAWSVALRLVAEHPLLGHGFATTEVFFPTAQDAAQGPVLGGVHNSYLEAAVDLGWVGTLLLGALAFSGLMAAWHVARSRGRYRWVGTVLLAGIVGGMVNGVFETGLLAGGGLIAFHFWLMVSMAHSIRLREKRDVRMPGLAPIETVQL